MGTRAAVSCNSRDWIATHWDGYPKNGLGSSLLKELRQKFTVAPGDAHYFDKHGKARSACWRAAADHSIDFATTSGEAEFNRIYGDFAEYEYKMSVASDANCATVKYRAHGISEWKGSSPGNGWKELGKVCLKARKKSVRKRKKPGC